MSSNKIPSKVSSHTSFKKYMDLQSQLDDMSKNLSTLSRLKDKVMVVKCGNNHLGNEQAMSSMAADLVILSKSGAKVILVHGAGPKMNDVINIFTGNIQKFVDGEMVVNEKNFIAVEMFLRGVVSSSIVSGINGLGGSAVAVSGRDNNCIVADKLRRIKKDVGSNIERMVELGMLGEPLEIDVDYIKNILDRNMIPVITPIGISNVGSPYVINADTMASFIADTMDTDALILMSDQDGILDEDGKTIRAISTDRLQIMLESGRIPINMKQKAEAAIKAVNGGVGYCSIINGNDSHILAIDLLFENGVGTVVYSSGNKNSNYPSRLVA